jgi:arylsulfatase
MTDDVGFGAPSTFGGVIPTPALDRIAKAGPPYNTFHTTALCSPTSAAPTPRPGMAKTTTY